MLSPMGTTSTLLAVAVGYLLGSLPVADVVAHRAGLPDLRTVGDRNPGFWNATRVAGRPMWAVLVGDAGKGVAAAGAGLAIGSWWSGALAGGAAVVGHCWPAIAARPGGRGVATLVGASIVLAPFASLIAAAAGASVAAVTRRVEWGVRAGVFGVPAAMLLVDGPERTAAIGAVMTVVGWRFLSAPRFRPAGSVADA